MTIHSKPPVLSVQGVDIFILKILKKCFFILKVAEFCPWKFSLLCCNMSLLSDFFSLLRAFALESNPEDEPNVVLSCLVFPVVFQSLILTSSCLWPCYPC